MDDSRRATQRASGATRNASAALSIVVAWIGASCSRSPPPSPQAPAPSASTTAVTPPRPSASTSAPPPAPSSAKAQVSPPTPDAATGACLFAAQFNERSDHAAIDHATRLLTAANASGKNGDTALNAQDEGQLAYHEAHQQKALADSERASLAARRARGPITEPKLPPAAERFTECRADAAGAWAIVELKVEYVPTSDDWSEPWHRDSRLGIARFDAQGKVVTGPVKTFMEGSSPTDATPKQFASGTMNCCTSTYGGAPRITFVGDVDGDGLPEVAVASSWANEGDGEEWSALFRATARAVTALAEGFDGIADDTGDGRVDLEYRETFSAGTACLSGFNRPGVGPKFIAHNVGDGTFKRDDAEAKGYAKRWCKAPPTKFDSVDAVVCAKLSHVPDAVVSKWIDAHFPIPDGGCEEEGGNTELHHAQKVKVPFTFDEEAGASAPSPTHPG